MHIFLAVFAAAGAAAVDVAEPNNAALAEHRLAWRLVPVN